MSEFSATVYIGGSGGFVCPFTDIAIERELLVLTPPWFIRWLVRRRRITAADTTAVSFTSTGLLLEKKNGMEYAIKGSNADAVMGALRSAGFPMAGSGR